MVVVDGEHPGGVQLAQRWEVDGGGRKGAVMDAMRMLLGLVLVLVVLELALVVRMVLDWVGVLAVGGGRWSIPARRMAHAVTEPVLAPVRRVLPPVRLGFGVDRPGVYRGVHSRADPAHDRGGLVMAGPVDPADGVPASDGNGRGLAPAAAARGAHRADGAGLRVSRLGRACSERVAARRQGGCSSSEATHSSRTGLTQLSARCCRA
jgi:YggT family protein